MKQYKRIYSALSLATVSLLNQGCGGGSSDSDDNEVVLTPNTKAPELLADWVSDCEGTVTSSTSTGTSGGGSGTARGDFSTTEFNFKQDGSGNAAAERYDESTCSNTNLRVSSNFANFSYTVGNATLDNNGMSAIELNINYNGSINYTMFRVQSNELFIADSANSNSGRDGSTAANRLNGFDNDGFDKR